MYAESPAFNPNIKRKPTPVHGNIIYDNCNICTLILYLGNKVGCKLAEIRVLPYIRNIKCGSFERDNKPLFKSETDFDRCVNRLKEKSI